MSTVDRSQFKGSTLNSIKDEQGRATKAIPSTEGGNRPGFHTINEGKNWRRVAPAHKPGEPAYRAKSTVFLECEVPEIDDDGKETGKREVKKKNIFIATQHSELTDDPILMYISFVQKRANDEITDKDERQKFMYPINGWRGKDGKWNWGIKPSIDYVCYCWDEKGTLGREQLWPNMLDAMKKISVERADDNAEIVPDIFTDPDEGYPLILTKEMNDKKKWETTVSCELPNKKESWEDFFSRTRITDEQFIDFMTKESLTELYKNVYTMRDFNMAVDGLQRFDKANKYGIFQNEEFLDKLAELKKKVPAYSPKNGSNSAIEEKKGVITQSAKAQQISATPERQTTNSEVKYPPVPAMKRIIKEYIAENYGSDYSLPELSKEQLVVWFDLAQQGDELPFDTIQTVEYEMVPEEKTPVADSPVPSTPVAATPMGEIDDELAAKIAALREKRKNGK